MSGVFLMRQPLSPYYWMPIVASGATAQGLIEMSNLVPLERSDGLYVNYLVNYTHRTSPLYAKTDDELLDGYEADLANLFPDAKDADRRPVPVPGPVRRAALEPRLLGQASADDGDPREALPRRDVAGLPERELLELVLRGRGAR